MTKREFLKAVLFHLKRAQGAYKLYGVDSVYLLARNIYKANTSILNLVNTYPYLIPEDLESEFLNLTEHLDVWVEQFNHLEHQTNPDPETDFIFERFRNTKPFPVNISKLIEQEIKNL